MERTGLCGILLSLLFVPAGALAVDGVIEINQAAVLAGGITPGDAKGFPVTISAAGSYRLTGNLAVTNPNVNAIEIATSGVVLDLNGFTISCFALPPANCAAGSGHGILVDSVLTRESFIVRNGTVRGFGQTGILLGLDAIVEDVISIHNGQTGISVLQGRVSDCVASQNGDTGIGASGSVVVRNQVRGNGVIGISLYADGIAADNVVADNAFGIYANPGGLISGNFLLDNPTGLNLGANAGYRGNQIDGSTTPIGGAGGVNLGGNGCDSAVCP